MLQEGRITRPGGLSPGGAQRESLLCGKEGEAEEEAPQQPMRSHRERCPEPLLSPKFLFPSPVTEPKVIYGSSSRDLFSFKTSCMSLYFTQSAHFLFRLLLEEFIYLTHIYWALHHILGAMFSSRGSKVNKPKALPSWCFLQTVTNIEST